MRIFLATSALVVLLAPHALYAQPTPASERPIAGLGHAHMDTSCSPVVSADFDRALALLHNFWYARALEAFMEVAKRDPDCAIAYWGAAKTYDHLFWDPPTRSDEAAAWVLVQKGLRAPRKSPREGMYLAAVAALYKDGGASPKSARDQAYVDAMAAAYAAHPDDETKLFYGLALLATVKEGTRSSSNASAAPGFAGLPRPSYDRALWAPWICRLLGRHRPHGGRDGALGLRPSTDALRRTRLAGDVLHDWDGALADARDGGTGWERTPWHATQRAAWEELRRSDDQQGEKPSSRPACD